MTDQSVPCCAVASDATHGAYRCSRPAGHPGPCAAHPVAPGLDKAEINASYGVVGSPARVERHHRLAVLRAQGYSEEWLADRKQHVASRWLECGTYDGANAGLIGNGDKLAQEMANMEALGRGESAAYREGLHRLVDRLDRLIAQEFGSDARRSSPPPASGGLVGAINDVFAFHDATDVPCLDSPQWPGDARAQLRYDLVAEEFKELTTALLVHHGKVNGNRSDLGSKSQLIGIADALADLIYICVGTALEFGIPLDRVWVEVQRSNMAKVGPVGTVQRRADGKILKPEGWTPPDIERVLFGPRPREEHQK